MIEPFFLVVRSEDEQLLTMLNQSLERLEQSDQLNQIETEWLGP